jgi:hypothetical protein
MRYLRAYASFFQGPHWLTILLAGAGCMVIPLAGWAIFVGYLLEHIERSHEQPAGEYPVFDLDRLGIYLGRGLWPSVLQFAVLLPGMLLVGLAVVLVVKSDPGKGPTTFARLFASGVPPATLALMLLLSLLFLPTTLYLGVAGSGSPGTIWSFTLDFLRLVWKEAILAQVFVLVTGVALLIIGLVPCGFGAPPALALAGLCQYHLLGQLYGLYVQRGGASIPAAPSDLVPTDV